MKIDTSIQAITKIDTQIAVAAKSYEQADDLIEAQETKKGKNFDRWA